jgi:hypothetical protein
MDQQYDVINIARYEENTILVKNDSSYEKFWTCKFFWYKDKLVCALVLAHNYCIWNQGNTFFPMHQKMKNLHSDLFKKDER